MATQPVRRLQIRPIVHNWGAFPTIPPSYIRVRAIAWGYDRGQKDTQTRVTTIHFASSTTHEKCIKKQLQTFIYSKHVYVHYHFSTQGVYTGFYFGK